MVISISGITAILPQIIIATIISFYFYYSTRKVDPQYPNEHKGAKTENPNVKADGIQGSDVITPDSDPQIKRISRQIPLTSSVRVSDSLNISRFMITIVLWAGSLVVFSSPVHESKFIPLLGSPIDYVLYLPLGVLVIVSITAFVSFTFSLDMKRKIVLVASTVALTIGFFYTPGLTGFFFNKVLYIVLVIYLITLLSGILSFISAFYISRRMKLNLSIGATVASYVYMLGLFATKTLSVVIHIR